MRIDGDYRRDGFALVEGLLPRGVARGLMRMVRQSVPDERLPLSIEPTPILDRPTFEIYGHNFAPFQALLWGLTPAMEATVGKPLVPTYAYFRIYREGDILRVHRDRPACEHSLSLTLDYSDDAPWALEVGKQGADGPADLFADDFGPEPRAALAMQVGDAVAYSGTTHRHGRTTPNPNGWSAHLFLHFVDPEGPHADQAYDGQGEAAPVNFLFEDSES